MFPLQFQVGFYLAAERARFAQERQMEVGLAPVLYYALKYGGPEASHMQIKNVATN